MIKYDQYKIRMEPYGAEGISFPGMISKITQEKMEKTNWLLLASSRL